MKEDDCGSCDHQGRVELKRVECLVDGEWHERGDKCEDFKDYVHSKLNEQRASEAREIGRGRQAAKDEQSRREFEEKMAQKDREHAEELQRLRMEFDRKQWRASWWWQIVLFVIGTIVGAVLNP